MGLDTYALITVEDFKDYGEIENSEIEVGAFSVYGSDGTAATVAKAGNTITLVKTAGANPGTTTINIAAAAYDTLAELVAYINTLPGWVANLVGQAAAASTDLKNFGATNCLGTANEVTLQIYDNYTIERFIERASAVIEKVLGRNIKSRSYKERIDGADNPEVFVENFPITALEIVSCGELGVIRVKYELTTAYNAYAKVTTTGVILTVDGVVAGSFLFADYATMALLAAAIDAVANWTAEVTDGSYNNWPTTLLIEKPNISCNDAYGYLEVPDEPLDDVDVDLDSGIIYVPSAAVEGFQNIYVAYTAGWTTVPADIVEACCKLAKEEFDSKDEDVGMKSEGLGDYSYSRADIEEIMGTDTWKKLMMYRKVKI